MKEFQFIKLVKLRNVPIYVHWSLCIVLLFVAVASLHYAFLFASIISILAVTLIHELGHMYLAQSLGLKTYRINLYLAHASCERELAESDYKNHLIAWGGVLAQAIIFIPSIIIFHIYIDQFPDYLIISLFLLGHVSFKLHWLIYFHCLILMENHAGKLFLHKLNIRKLRRDYKGIF